MHFFLSFSCLDVLHWTAEGAEIVCSHYNYSYSEGEKDFIIKGDNVLWWFLSVPAHMCILCMLHFVHTAPKSVLNVNSALVFCHCLLLCPRYVCDAYYSMLMLLPFSESQELYYSLSNLKQLHQYTTTTCDNAIETSLK